MRPPHTDIGVRAARGLFAVLAVSTALLFVTPANAEEPRPSEAEQKGSLQIADYLEARYFKESILPGLDPRASKSRWESFLSLPVSEGLRVRGGVQIDYVREWQRGYTAVEARPAVGFEMRY